MVKVTTKPVWSAKILAELKRGQKLRITLVVIAASINKYCSLTNQSLVLFPLFNDTQHQRLKLTSKKAAP